MTMQKTAIDNHDFGSILRPLGDRWVGDSQELSVTASPKGFFFSDDICRYASDLTANASAFTGHHGDFPFI